MVCVNCGETAEKGKVLCTECENLRLLSKTKNIGAVEKVRHTYNKRHGTRLSYGQFVSLLQFISERWRYARDNRAEKENTKKGKTII